MSTRILITDAQGPAAVAAVRSLGRSGRHPVVACAEGIFPLAATSRYCRGLFRVPLAEREPERYAESILALARRGACDAILPLSDSTLAACAPVRDRIEERVPYCAASGEALDWSSDKWRALERGKAVGLKGPEARLIRNEEDWRSFGGEVHPPVVFRSRKSILRTPHGLLKPSTVVCFDPEHADREARLRILREQSFIVSSFMPGQGRGVYLFMVSGRPVVWFGHLRVRETDPRGSPACAAIPVPPSRVEVDRCAALLASCGVEGAAMVEFRRDSVRGEDRLVEVNPRLWGSLPLAVGAGLDFPRFQVEYFMNGIVPKMPEPPSPGRGFRYLSAELSHVLHAWKGPPAGWGADYPTFRQACSGVVDAFRQGFGFYHQQVEDPLPGIVEPFAYVLGRISVRRQRRENP